MIVASFVRDVLDLQVQIDAVGLGAIYALMAVGIGLVFGVLRLVNFAYGELIMVAGYTLYLMGGSPVPWLVMAAVAVLAAIATGILTDYVAFRPVRAKSVTAVLITSFAFSTLLQNAALLLISPRPRNVPLPEIFSDTIRIGGAVTPVRNVLTIIGGLIEGNEAFTGGGVAVVSGNAEHSTSDRVFVEQGTILRDNEALSGNGGALFAELHGASLAIAGATFYDNRTLNNSDAATSAASEMLRNSIMVSP